MADTGGKWGDDEYSVIGDEGKVGFIDPMVDKSVCNYNLEEEGPIVISVPFPFVDGKPQSVVAGETAFHSITIKNTTDEAVDLWTKIHASTPEKCFTLSLLKPPSANDPGSEDFLESYKMEDRMLQPGETLTIWLSCKPKEIGLCTSIVHFDVGNDRIERVAFLLAEDRVSQSLAARKPYARGVKKKQFSTEEFVAGQRPKGTQARVFRNRLPRYDIPKDMRELIESKQTPDVLLGGLTQDNYASYFKTLLIMEELQLERDMRAYDMDHVTMKRKGQFLTLVVLGLAERRPSLVHGDHIFAKFAGADDSSAPYQGFIHRVEADEVYLRFDSEFHNNHIDGNLYDVSFTYSRLQVRRLYQAVDAANYLENEFLFPCESSATRNMQMASLVPISCSLNDQQILAVEMILGCKGGPPYVIHGPPGTGKTKTLVEAILQLYKNQNDARILVCAPSNSAADHILEKLLCEKDVNIRENEIFRLNATSRSIEDVNPDHIRFCFFDELIFKPPPLQALTRYRIIISTYMSASLLHAEGVRRGHFSHIILDEAGQGSEPETMVPISHLYHPNTVVVLAGDPMQLGPVIHSRDSIRYGLDKSFMERLFEYDPYCLGDERFMTKLVRNYRCHPEILHLPSNLFYEGDLIACKDSTDDTNSLLSLVKLLPGMTFPVLFFGIQGCDEREGNNPSWFNRIEASKVVEIIKKLTGRGNLNEAEIGVITPYRQQVLKLKKALEDLDMPEIKIGSVEQFQGQERRVIIVSTVRSTVKHNDFDRAHCLGFLSNPRRFNVAITRAISLLVIVGNPHIISKDRHWNKLLWYCDDNKSYQGCSLPEREQFFEDYPVLADPADQLQVQAEHNDGQGDWNDGWNDNYQTPEDGAKRYAENALPSEEHEWSQRLAQSEFSNPVKDKDDWGDGWK